MHVLYMWGSYAGGPEHVVQFAKMVHHRWVACVSFSRCVKFPCYRDHFVNAPTQWETTLQCNVVSHWPGTFTKWSLLSYRIVVNTSKYLYPRPTKLEGGYTGFTLSVRLSVCPSVRPSVRPSVCRRHGFRSISQVCFGISISNFICMLMVAIGRSLLIFSVVTFKMAAWQPYWIFWFPDSNFSLALNINFKLQRHNTYVYG